MQWCQNFQNYLEWAHLIPVASGVTRGFRVGRGIPGPRAARHRTMVTYFLVLSQILYGGGDTGVIWEHVPRPRM